MRSTNYIFFIFRAATTELFPMQHRCALTSVKDLWADHSRSHWRARVSAGISQPIAQPPSTVSQVTHAQVHAHSHSAVSCVEDFICFNILWIWNNGCKIGLLVQRIMDPAHGSRLVLGGGRKQLSEQQGCPQSWLTPLHQIMHLQPGATLAAPQKALEQW